MCTALVPIWDIVPLSDTVRAVADEHTDSFLSFSAMAETGGLPNAERFARMALDRSVWLNKIANWLDGQNNAG